MRNRYLEITFRNGKPLAAYLYLPRQEADTSSRTVRCEEGLLIDVTGDGRAIGIEITAPNKVSLDAVNRVLAEVHQEPATAEELAPLPAA